MNQADSRNFKISSPLCFVDTLNEKMGKAEHEHLFYPIVLPRI